VGFIVSIDSSILLSEWFSSKSVKMASKVTIEPGSEKVNSTRFLRLRKDE
jgi:hypothetical protein